MAAHDPCHTPTPPPFATEPARLAKALPPRPCYAAPDAWGWLGGPVYNPALGGDVYDALALGRLRGSGEAFTRRDVEQLGAALRSAARQ